MVPTVLGGFRFAEDDFSSNHWKLETCLEKPRSWVNARFRRMSRFSLEEHRNAFAIIPASLDRERIVAIRSTADPCATSAGTF